MDQATTPYSVHQCSKCPGDTEYYCKSCPCFLCPRCKEDHVKNLKTMDHNVATYRDKFSYIPKQQICIKRLSNVHKKYCEACQVPVCGSCFGHKSHIFLVSLFGPNKHTILSIPGAYKNKRRQHRETIHTIRSDALFYRPVLMHGIRADFKTCQTKFSFYQSEMLTKAQTLNDLIDDVLYDLLKHVFSDFDFKHRCLKQMIEMCRHILSLQLYEDMFEKSAISPLQFLSSIKVRHPQIHFTLHTSQLSMTESLNKDDVMESLNAIQIKARENRRIGKECLLKQMSAPEFHQSLTVTGVDRCRHISFVTSDRVWVSNRNNLILTDTTGVILHRVDDICNYFYGGLHTVNSESDLIYVDRDYNINKLSKDMKTTTTFIERTYSTWTPLCVYWSPSTGYLLVAMYDYRPQSTGDLLMVMDKEQWTGKVIRYNQSGQLIQTIQYDKRRLELYRKPNYITENINGDVVVSDYDYPYGAVVATERGGGHRFSYKGHPSGSGLRPRGICTDALSHILVCDGTTKTVQLIDRDGQFLSHLLIRPSGTFTPHGLSYDVSTHRLWVGSWDNKTVVIYRYITRHGALTATTDLRESLSEIPITVKEKPHQGNQCLLKLMSGAEFHQSLTLTGVHCCFHISCVTSDRVWVSDRNNLILTDTTGVPLYRVEDACSDLYRGLHTVNGESGLIYIDRKYNINQLSKDMKTTTTFIERTDSTWRPQCVYWSPSTGDLLVGMYREPWTGKVTRYNQSGELTQTIQHNNTGPELYRQPNYITENKNGDVVVSDNDFVYGSGAVVVTESGGKHRFSYSGYPSGSGLQPRGICTDALSHIIVCDDRTNTVQMLDRDGQFLSHLLSESKDMDEPYSLSYDDYTHHLWVGSHYNNKVCVYRYIDRQDTLQDEDKRSTNKDTLFSSTQAA